MKLLEDVSVKILAVVFSPFIDAKGFLKFPKQKLARIILVSVFMITVMLAAMVIFEFEGYLYRLPFVLIERIRK